MSSNDDLIAFLSARLAEDEAAARAATPGPWAEIEGDEGHVVQAPASPGDQAHDLHEIAEMMSCDYHPDRREADAGHIARHDPARVLREVGAKRLLVGHEGVHRCDWGEHRGGDLTPCMQARLLALPYEDHPGYLPEWKP